MLSGCPPLILFKKRKAQNRAAQRAFRERKEAHVKGLENRVTELEELTKNKHAENQLLKSQVQSLQARLMALSGGNLNFDFTMKNVQNTNALSNSPTLRNPFQQIGQSNVQQQSSPSPSSGNLTDSSIFRSGRSSLATSPENDISKNTSPNIDVPFDLFSTKSAGPAPFYNNSNHASPLFSSDLFGNSSPVSGGLTSAPVFSQPEVQRTPSILDNFASTLASLTQGQSPQSVTNAFNSAMSSSASTVPISSFTSPSTSNLFDMNDPLFTTWRDPSISSSNDDGGFDIFDTMFSSMSPGAFNLVDTTGLTDFVIDSPISIPQQPQPVVSAPGDKPIPCPELWDKVKNHPQFDEIDIDQLCAEMRSKAKVCVLSKSGYSH
jgi:AP-1-like transcription factor